MVVDGVCGCVLVDEDERWVHGENTEGRLVESTTILEEVVVVEVYDHVCAVFVVEFPLIGVRVVQRCDVHRCAHSIALIWHQEHKFLQIFVDPQDLIGTNCVHKGHCVDVRPHLRVPSVEIDCYFSLIA